MNVLCVGDVVGKPGRDALRDLLPGIVEEKDIDFVIVNGENSAAGSGITEKIAEQILACGCHVITSGDHIWDQKDMDQVLGRQDKLLRPANFPQGVAGHGWGIYSTAQGQKVGVISLIGRVFMRFLVENPFTHLDAIVEQIRKTTSIIFVDMHAEATSEKVALGIYADGKVSAVVGTHTHIQTADEKILPRGTAYLTDLGMTGPYDSVIGSDKDAIIQRFLTGVPVKFHVASQGVKLHGAVISVDDATGRALSIERLQRDYTPSYSPEGSQDLPRF